MKKRYMIWSALILLIISIIPAFANNVSSKKRSLIIVGGEIDYPPYSYLDEKGDPSGFQVDLTRAIARVMGMDIEIRLSTWAEARKALENGKIDIISGMFYSDERAQIYDFSQPYSIISSVIFTRKGSPTVKSIDDLRNKEIIVMHGEAMHDYVLKHNLSDRLLLADTPADAMRWLASGRGDYALGAQMPGLYWIRELGLSNIVSIDQPVKSFNNCFAVRNGNVLLLSNFTEGLGILNQTGEYQQIYKEWLGVLEPKEISLTEALKYASTVIIPLLVLIALAFFWSWSLRKRVAVKTADLNREVVLHKQSKESLLESEARFRMFAELAPVGILISDHQEKTVYVSRKFVELFGYTIEEIPSLAEWMILAYPDKALRIRISREWSAAIESARKDVSEIKPMEYPVTCKDGTVKHIEFRMAPASDLNFIVFTDITDRIKQEEERLELERQVLHSQKLESLGVLAGGIAHDFNNLLLAIIGNLDMSLYELSPVSGSRKYIEASMKAAQRAADLTRQMLAYSGKGHFVVMDININELINENLHILKSGVSKNVTIQLNLQADIPCISADTGQIQQVVMNFITNASEAIGEGYGSINISTGVMDCDDEYLRKSFVEEKPPAGRYVYLEVKDTGCGMDEDTKRRIFDNHIKSCVWYKKAQ